MNYLILGCSICLSTAQGVFSNAFGKNSLKNFSDSFAFNALSSLVSVLILTLLGGQLKMPSLFTLLLGVVFGLVTAFGQLMYVMSLSAGPMSFSVMFGTFGMIIPTLAGVIFWKDSMNFAQAAGILLLIAAIVLCTGLKKDKQITPIWILYCFLNFFSSGMVGIMQKIHQTSKYQGELNEFLIIAFVTAALAFTFLYFFSSKVKKAEKTFSFRSKVPLLAIVSGACIGLVNKINLYLSGQLPSAIFFPIVNGGVVLLSSLAAFLFFRETLKKTQVAGLVCGIAAIGLLSNILQNFF